MVRVAVCAIFKNEEAYLYEWLSFHAFIGVTKFFLYNNNSTDDSLAVIASWRGPATIQVIDWPLAPGQTAAYSDMITRHRSEADWCAFIDCDEFICPQTPFDLPATLALLRPPVTGLYVHWRMFGSSGQVKQTPGLVTERFTRRAYDDFEPHNIGKTIVRLSDAIADVGFCHIVRSTGRLINDSLDEIDQNGTGINHRSSHKLLALNHYFTKSLEEWRRRRSMGRATQPADSAHFRRTEDEFHMHDQNVQQDLLAQRITQRMKPKFYPVPDGAPKTEPQVQLARSG